MPPFRCWRRPGIPARLPRHPDADLIAAYNAFVACDREMARTSGRADMTDEECDARFRRWDALYEAVIAIRARTPEGVTLLALAALRDTGHLDSVASILGWDGHSRPDGIEDGSRIDRLLWNIVESTRAMAGWEVRR